MKLSRIFDKKSIKSGEIYPEDIFVESLNVSNFDNDSFEGRFIKPINKKLFIIIGFLFATSFFIFIYKAYIIQVRDNVLWSARADKNYIKKSPVLARRGVIKDRNDVLLAWNSDQVFNSTLFSSSSIQNYNNATTSIQNKKNDILRREYYKDSIGLSSTLGHVSYPKKDNKGVYWQTEYKGEEGIEEYYNNILSGKNGSFIKEVDVRNSIEKNNIINNAIDGEDVNLNIDVRLQKIFYKHLKDVVDGQGFNGGSAIMMDVNTGEVLTSVSYPDYDNNIFTNASTGEEKDLKSDYLNNKRTPMLNRTIAGLYTPGSTVKPFMLYAALNEGVIGEYDSIYSSGKLTIKNKYGGPDTVFKDWKAHGYTDARKAIAESSDEYFYQVGGGYLDQKGIGISGIEKYMKFFGFASSTGIDIPKEKSGIVPSPEWKKKNFADGDWLLGNTYHTSIGQYGFQTSPIELIRSISIIANGGYVITPRIASTSEEIKKINLNLDKHILEVVRDGMRRASLEGGTGHYFSDLPFKVSSKSGTAQLGFNNERVNSLSTGFYPSDKPKYAWVFMMEGGPSTNKIASSKVMRRVFQDILDTLPEYIK